jgi:hypothetical protein
MKTPLNQHTIFSDRLPIVGMPWCRLSSAESQMRWSHNMLSLHFMQRCGDSNQNVCRIYSGAIGDRLDIGEHKIIQYADINKINAFNDDLMTSLRLLD